MPYHHVLAGRPWKARARRGVPRGTGSSVVTRRATRLMRDIVICERPQMAATFIVRPSGYRGVGYYERFIVPVRRYRVSAVTTDLRFGSVTTSPRYA